MPFNPIGSGRSAALLQFRANERGCVCVRTAVAFASTKGSADRCAAEAGKITADIVARQRIGSVSFRTMACRDRRAFQVVLGYQMRANEITRMFPRHRAGGMPRVRVVH